MKTIQLTVPFGLSISHVVEMFGLSGCSVDDMCSVCKYGKIIEVWIPDDAFTDRDLSEHRGSFCKMTISER